MHAFNAYHKQCARKASDKSAVRLFGCVVERLVLCTESGSDGHLVVRAQSVSGNLVGMVADMAEARALANTCKLPLVDAR